MKSLILKYAEYFYLGNYFYGICVVALSMEASLQMGMGLNDPLFYVLSASASVLFYTIPYISVSSLYPADSRNLWYIEKQRFLHISGFVLALVFFATAVLYLLGISDHLSQIRSLDFFIFVFPLGAAVAYYFGIGRVALGEYSLRRVGWLKPFIIGLVWGGVVTLYPLLFRSLEVGKPLQLEGLAWLLLLKNVLFVSMLAVIFDFKDYPLDLENGVNTYIVIVGRSKTIFLIISPVTLVFVVSFVHYSVSHLFSPMNIFLNTIPFVLLIPVAYALYRTRTTLFYFAVVDGLMLIKALFGIAAALYY